MNPIARDLATLRYAVRGIELDEREARELENAGASWTLAMTEVVASLFEKVREVTFLTSVNGIDPRLTGVERLVMAADRDLGAYRGAALRDPNRHAAGRAALTGIEMAVNELLSIRTALQQELAGVYATWDGPDAPGSADVPPPDRPVDSAPDEPTL